MHSTRSARDKVYQLLAHGWFSPGTPASSTTKTGRHDIAEILQSGIKHNKSNHIYICICKFILYCLLNGYVWIPGTQAMKVVTAVKQLYI